MQEENRDMLFNYGQLIHRMKEKHVTQQKLAQEIGISAHSINMRLNNQREFKASEVVSVCKVLNIPPNEIPAYFFSELNSTN